VGTGLFFWKKQKSFSVGVIDMVVEPPVHRFKPTASIRTRIMLAALLWSGIGLLLMVRGYLAVDGSGKEWFLIAALIVGSLKSLLLLDRMAVKNMGRIRDRGSDVCLGSIYSPKTWLLVAGMVLVGRLLRASTIEGWLVGLLYVAVGWALLFSSRKGWLRWMGDSRDSG